MESCYHLKETFIIINALNDLKCILMNFKLQNLSEIHYCGYKDICSCDKCLFNG